MESVRKSNYRQRNTNLLNQAYACFSQHVKTEQDALEIIFKLLFNNKTSLCPFCVGSNIFRESGSRSLFCLDCRKISWFTSSSFFEGVRKPKAYLLAIWFMECGISFSALTFAKYAQVSYDTAWTILKKLDMLVEEKFPIDYTAVFSFHFREIFSKRSCETPANQKPAFEEDKLESSKQEESSSLDIFDSISRGEATEEEYQLNEIDKQILDLLTKEKLDIDAIVDRTGLNISQTSLALTMLELADRIKQSFGGRFEAVPERKAKMTERLNVSTEAIIRDVKCFVKDTLHGISRRYLQFYLARFWCLTDKTHWGRGELLKACSTARKISKADILIYVSPLSVKMHTPGTVILVQ